MLQVCARPLLRQTHRGRGLLGGAEMKAGRLQWEGARTGRSAPARLPLHRRLHRRQHARRLSRARLDLPQRLHPPASHTAACMSCPHRRAHARTSVQPAQRCDEIQISAWMRWKTMRSHLGILEHDMCGVCMDAMHEVRTLTALRSCTPVSR